MANKKNLDKKATEIKEKNFKNKTNKLQKNKTQDALQNSASDNGKENLQANAKVSINLNETLGEIKCEQVYTKEVLSDFADYTVKSNKSTIIIYVCTVIILMCAIAMFSFGDIYSGVIYTILGLFFAFYGKFIKFVMLKNNKKNIGNKDVYTFGENSLKVDTYDAQGKQISSTTIVYENLFEVKKYKSYGFIYVNKAVAYIVNLQNFKDVVDFNFALVRIENAINAKKLEKLQ